MAKAQQEEEKALPDIRETKILFEETDEIQKRRSMLKRLRQDPDNNYLYSDGYDKSRVLYALMNEEGLSDDFIRLVFCRLPDDEFALTLDFLHCAAVIMGEDYVREHLAGKTIKAGEACRQIREHYYDQQLQPMRETFEHLDEKIRAAIAGDTKTEHELELVKRGAAHDREMYEQKLQTMTLLHNSAMKQQRENAVQQYNADQALIGSLQTEIGVHLDQIKTMEGTIAKLEENISQRDEKITELEKQVQEMGRKAVRDTEGEPVSVMTGPDSGFIRILEEARRDADHQREVQGLNGQIQVLEGEVRERDQRIRELVKEAEDAQDQIEFLKVSLNVLSQKKIPRWQRHQPESAAVFAPELLSEELMRQYFQRKDKKETERKRTEEVRLQQEERSWQKAVEARQKEEDDRNQSARKQKLAEDQKAEDQRRTQEERREFCVNALIEGNYSEEQVKLLFQIMSDPQVPKSTLEYICNPNLPAYSMRAIVRLLGGGKEKDEDGENEE